MNKYRESLDCITSSVCENCNCNMDVGCQGCDILESKQVLEELIEKKTPAKVKYENRHGSGIDYYNRDAFKCPSCNRRLRNRQHDPYCPKCGQRIDWSDEDE